MASMRQKSASPLLLLLDADVVIETHRLDVWEALINRSRVACSATVVRDEVLFYRRDQSSVPTSLNLQGLVAAGRITMLEATTDDLCQLAAIVTHDVLEGLHAGESEALALLLGGKAKDHLFCSGDRAALRTLALLGLSQYGTSLEKVLQSLGLTKRLPENLTERFFREACDRFLSGTYAGAYEAELIREFDTYLPELPPWKR